MSVTDKLDSILEMLEILKDFNLKIYNMLSKSSQETVKKEITQQSGTTLTWEIEYNGRNYKNFKPCKYKCGGLTSWPEDYKKGDQPLHIHPTDKEILGFSEEGLDGKIHCPVVRKK